MAALFPFLSVGGLLSTSSELVEGTGSVSLVGAATSNFFVTTKVLSQQTRVCRNKHMFVVTRHTFCHDKSMLAATKLLLQNILATTKLLLQQIFVLTNMCLS